MSQHPGAENSQPGQSDQPYGSQPPSYGSQPQPYGSPPQPYGAPQQYQAAPSYQQGGGVSPNPGMGVRLVARILDGIIVGIPFAIVWFVLLGGAASQVKTDPQTGEVTGGGGALVAAIAVLGILALLTLLYEVVLIALRGATLGKSIMKVKVVREHSGELPGWGPSILRWLIPVIGSFACGIGQYVVYLSPFFDSSGRQQGWHDKVAHTQVVRAG